MLILSDFKTHSRMMMKQDKPKACNNVIQLLEMWNQISS